MQFDSKKSIVSDTLLMIRPKSFGSNPETLEDNTFQGPSTDKSIEAKALEEFDRVVKKLRNTDFEVIVIEDTEEPRKYDAIFPNNWLSTHDNGAIVTYPMYSENRRLERREDLVNQLMESHNYKKRYGFEYHEEDNLFLEGTGSMVLDRQNKKLYAGLSHRTYIQVLEKFAVLFGYQKLTFFTKLHGNKPVYHTNVMMCVADNYAIICKDCFEKEEEWLEVEYSLKEDGKEIILINQEQVEAFAGNALQVKTKLGEKYLLMSSKGLSSLNSNQIDRITSYNKLLSFDIPTIEQFGGGSIRCMLAELF